MSYCLNTVKIYDIYLKYISYQVLRKQKYISYQLQKSMKMVTVVIFLFRNSIKFETNFMC